MTFRATFSLPGQCHAPSFSWAPSSPAPISISGETTPTPDFAVLFFANLTPFYSAFCAFYLAHASRRYNSIVSQQKARWDGKLTYSTNVSRRIDISYISICIYIWHTALWLISRFFWVFSFGSFTSLLFWEGAAKRKVCNFNLFNRG